MEIVKGKYLPASKHVLWLDTNTDELKVWDNEWVSLIGNTTNNEALEELLEALSVSGSTEALKNVILYGPYSSKELAYSTITNSNSARIGLTVGIIGSNGVEEYWFKKECNSINDLIPKSNSTYNTNGQDADTTPEIDSDYEVQSFLEGIDNTKKLKDVLSGTVDENGIVHFNI